MALCATEARRVVYTEDDAVQLSECIVCMDALRDTVLIPCGHLMFCSNCSSRLHERCPVCMGAIQGYCTIKF